MTTLKKTLLIVESPAKCKKIEEYLGSNYKCVASYGHLRTIQSLKDINIRENFKPTYHIINETIKEKQIKILTKEIKNADEILLASDADREGEMIAYSIIVLFNLPLTTKRITFNEITKPALQHAILNPRTIDMDLVYAQQTRQILDVLIGFKVSPVLWKCISQPKGKEYSLSAGRCQTPALKLVYENQKEIENLKEKLVYNITGYFTNLNLPFILKPENKFQNKKEIIDFFKQSMCFSHTYNCSSPVLCLKKPPEPFTTSRLQQNANNKLHFSPKETMEICQSLYESGYITYMRTDSKTYSQDFIIQVNTFVQQTYGENYVMNYEDIGFSSKNEIKFSQEAHEAIRPTNISLKLLPNNMSSKEKKMYSLIWKNTLESCLPSARCYSITSTVTAPLNYEYSYKSEIIDFLGWKIVENLSNENKEYQYLQHIKKKSIIQYNKIYANITLRETKSHYSEAKLVQLLEEKGIGRPSTFSSIIDKIQQRGYVKKEDIKGKEISCCDYILENDNITENIKNKMFGNEKNKLVIQPLGIIVIEFLENHFRSLFDYEYTSSMENDLDKISKGNIVWQTVCSSCNEELDILIQKINHKNKLEIQIDENNTFLIGKHGPVIKSIENDNKVVFKSVKKDVQIDKLMNGEYTIDELIDNSEKQNKIVLGKWNEYDVSLHRGRFGLYACCGEKKINLKELNNTDFHMITMKQIEPFLEQSSSNMIREINSNISLRKGPRGNYIFYKTNKMKKPKFYDIQSFYSETNEDYEICDIDILKSWIFDKYKIK